jgi:hypothetical protein
MTYDIVPLSKLFRNVPLDLAYMGLIIYGKPWDYISKGISP